MEGTHCIGSHGTTRPGLRTTLLTVLAIVAGVGLLFGATMGALASNHFDGEYCTDQDNPYDDDEAGYSCCEWNHEQQVWECNEYEKRCWGGPGTRNGCGYKQSSHYEMCRPHSDTTLNGDTES